MGHYDDQRWLNIHPRTFCRPLQISDSQVYFLQILSLSYLLVHTWDSYGGFFRDFVSHLSYGKALVDWIIFCIRFYLNRCEYFFRLPSLCYPKELSSSHSQSNYWLENVLGHIDLFCPTRANEYWLFFLQRIRRLVLYFCKLSLVFSLDSRSLT